MFIAGFGTIFISGYRNDISDDDETSPNYTGSKQIKLVADVPKESRVKDKLE